MKKLVTAFAACALAGLVDAQVESVNIVGYQTVIASGQYFSSGPTFISVGDANSEWRLGDIIAEGMDPSTDFIQFLSADTANTILSATYVDLTAAGGDPDLVGWWNLDIDTPLDDLVFSAGTSFLCNFGSTGVKLTYAGEVLGGAKTLDLSGQQYPFVSNFTPIDLTLGDLTVEGMDPSTDFIQFLSDSTANTILSATYVDSIAAGGDPDLVGWWNLDIDTPLNDTPLPAGASFLGSFVSTGIKITFPDPLAP
jgi:hypothetical protein